jgi:pimeloyl-ACP methyl ester carboxylesterase
VSTRSFPLTPTSLHVADEVLDDLRRRLTTTKWPLDAGNDDGYYVHFMRKPGVGPNPVPLILSHGWPWTFWHCAKVIDPLADPAAFGADQADAFDVIVPSLPGFGFSTPLTKQPDMNFWKIAEVWHELMTGVLGYERYAAGGCDVGALVCASSGTSMPRSCMGSISGRRRN